MRQLNSQPNNFAAAVELHLYLQPQIIKNMGTFTYCMLNHHLIAVLQSDWVATILATSPRKPGWCDHTIPLCFRCVTVWCSRLCAHVCVCVCVFVGAHPVCSYVLFVQSWRKMQRTFLTWMTTWLWSTSAMKLNCLRGSMWPPSRSYVSLHVPLCQLLWTT